MENGNWIGVGSWQRVGKTSREIGEGGKGRRWTYEIATDRKAVGAALPVRARVPRRELAVAQEVVRLRLGLGRELLVDRARVDQQRRLRFRRVFLRSRVGQSLVTNSARRDGMRVRSGDACTRGTHLEILRDLEEGRVRDGDDVDLAREREVEAGARPVAVADHGEPVDALCLERRNQSAHGGQGTRGGVLAEPAHEVVVAAGVERVLRERIVVEVVRDEDLEAVTRKVVGQKLIGR